MSGNPLYGTYRWKVMRRGVLRRDGYICQLRMKGCTGRATQADHTLRPEEGGAFFDQANLKASCKSCNVAKRNRDLAQRAKRAENRLQRW